MTEEGQTVGGLNSEVRNLLEQALALLDSQNGPLDLRARLADLIEALDDDQQR